MNSIYKYHIDRRTIYWTLIHLAVFALLTRGLYHLYEGGYFSAWFTSFIVALIALMSLSIPRRIVVTDEMVEVRCLLDITEIRRDEIASVRRMEPKQMKWLIPIFGGCGFFGYYGHFFSLKHFDRVLIYASEWRNFVEITTIYEDRVYVSCTEADRLVAELTPPGGNLISEDDDDDEDEPIDKSEAETEASECPAAEVRESDLKVADADPTRGKKPDIEEPSDRKISEVPIAEPTPTDKA